MSDSFEAVDSFAPVDSFQPADSFEPTKAKRVYSFEPIAASLGQLPVPPSTDIAAGGPNLPMRGSIMPSAEPEAPGAHNLLDLLRMPQGKVVDLISKLRGSPQTPATALLPASIARPPTDVTMEPNLITGRIEPHVHQKPESFLNPIARAASSFLTDPLILGPEVAGKLFSYAAEAGLTEEGTKALQEALPKNFADLPKNFADLPKNFADLPKNFADLPGEAQSAMLEGTKAALKEAPDAAKYFTPEGLNLLGKNIVPQTLIDKALASPVIQGPRKLMADAIGGQEGALAVTHPKAAEILTSLHERLRGNQSISQDALATLKGQWDALTPAEQDAVHTALNNPQSMEPLKVDVGLDYQNPEMYGFKPLEKAASPEEQAQIRSTLAAREADPTLAGAPKAALLPTSDPSKMESLLQGMADSSYEQFQNARDMAAGQLKKLYVEMSDIGQKEASNKARSFVRDWLNGAKMPEQMDDAERMILANPEFQSAKTAFDKYNKIVDVQKGLSYVNDPAALEERLSAIGDAPEAIGKATDTIEARKAEAAAFLKSGTASEQATGLHNIQTMTDEGVKNWVVKATKITPEVIMNPAQRKIYTTMSDMRDEIGKTWHDMFPEKFQATSMKNQIPAVTEGEAASRFYGQPRLTPMPPSGGLRIDPETGNVMTIKKANWLIEQENKANPGAVPKPPLMSDLSILFGVGKKEATDAKIIDTYLRKLPDAVGSAYDGKNLAEGNGIFSKEELQHLPGRFAKTQFPQEVIDRLRRGLDAGRAPMDSFGRFWDGYMNTFKSWTLASPKFLLKKSIGDAWQHYLEGTDLTKAVDAAAIKLGKDGALEAPNGVRYSYEDVRRMAKEYNLTSGIAGNEISGLDNMTSMERADAAASDAEQIKEQIGQVLGPNSPIPKAGHTALREIDASNKLLSFVSNLSKGMTPDRAAAATYNAFFDYADISPFMRDRLKPTFLFPTFPAKMIPYQIKALATRPDKFALLNHVYDFFDKVDPNVPLDQELKAHWPLRKGNYLYLMGNMVPAGQIETVLQPLLSATHDGVEAGATSVGTGLAASANPMVSAAISTWANKDLGSGFTIENYDKAKTTFLGMPVEKRLEPFIKALPVAGTVYSDLRNVGRYTSPIMQEPPRSLPQHLIDALVQRGIYDNPEKRIVGKTYEINDKAKNLQKAIKDIGMGAPGNYRDYIDELMKKIDELQGK